MDREKWVTIIGGILTFLMVVGCFTFVVIVQKEMTLAYEQDCDKRLGVGNWTYESQSVAYRPYLVYVCKGNVKGDYIG